VFGCSSMMRQRPTLAPGSFARSVSVGAIAVCESIQTPSLSVRGGLWLTGYVVLDPYGKEIDPKEWLDVEYVDWKSSGDTRFAPLASAKGEIECNGFWNHKPPRTDTDRGRRSRSPRVRRS
jgi:hypothetical protein